MQHQPTIPTTREGPRWSPQPALQAAAHGPRSRRRHDEAPALVFSPLAWLKLKFFCHAGDTEVGGFGISAEADALYVEDFVTVRQSTTAVTVEFDDAAVADHFDAAVDRGLRPERFARLWCHTHPGDSAEPSSVDEHTFARVFGSCDWAVMFILCRTGRTYARLAFNAGPGGSTRLPVDVDWESWPQAVLERPEELSQLAGAWAAEFDRNVHPASLLSEAWSGPSFPRLTEDDGLGLDELHALQSLAEQAEEHCVRLSGAGEAVSS
jgi:hypothetical protein